MAKDYNLRASWNERFRRHGHTGEVSRSRARNISLHIMEAENMDFHSSSFDLVTSINVLQHIIDEKTFSRTIKNIVRVIKPSYEESSR